MLGRGFLITSRKLNGYQFFYLLCRNFCLFYTIFLLSLFYSSSRLSNERGVGSVLRMPPWDDSRGLFVWIPVIV
ncbi:hypothetical protein CCMA1212_005613 [Trichoderma ghanense]|uniref:Uncharacterized protein n=1 Tax=Trichoderma ghanense TaxID=65468 RepID=A0ABY2H2R7_9HYPO